MLDNGQVEKCPKGGGGGGGGTSPREDAQRKGGDWKGDSSVRGVYFGRCLAQILAVYFPRKGGK